MHATKTEKVLKATTFSSHKRMFHMHASRPGPVLSNEIMLAIKEYERNPNLETIVGVQQPGGTVSKFLGYWLGGLPSALRSTICDNVKQRMAPAEFGHFLCEQAGMVPYSPADFVDDCVEPLYDAYEAVFAEANITRDALDEMRVSGASHNLASVMTECSLIMLNRALSARGLPTLEIIQVPSEILACYSDSKHVDVDVMRRNLHDGIGRMQKRAVHSYDFVKKDLRCYVAPPNEEQLQKLQRRFRNNLSHKGVRLANEDILHCYRTQAHKEPSIVDYIKCADASYRKAIFRGKGEIPYVSGEDMVRIMFEMAAREDGVYMGMQEFMRSFDYSIYDDMIERHEELPAQFAAFKTWDTSLFPEFDTNVVFALKYLKP